MASQKLRDKLTNIGALLHMLNDQYNDVIITIIAEEQGAKANSEAEQKGEKPK
jgi:hypothetical protein